MTQQPGDAGEHCVHRRLPASAVRPPRGWRRTALPHRQSGDSRSCAARSHAHDPPPPAPARRRRGQAASPSATCRTGSAGPTATASSAGRTAHRRCRSAAGSRAHGRARCDRRALSSTAGSHTRLMSSSMKRDAVGWRGSNRSYAARLTKPKVSLPRVGVRPVASSRSSTIAPAISLPWVIASSATCGPATSGIARGEAANAGVAGQPAADVGRGEVHLECWQRRLRDR